MGLSPDVLKQLYLDDGVPEAEIGKRFGISQVQVGRLRKRWEIPTLSKAQRIGQSLPMLSDRQKEILIGSLLGDGWMAETSKEAARFQETHSLEQEPYLLWKADEIQPFVSSIYPVEKHEKGQVYRGKGFSTQSCPQLRPLFDLFYAEGQRVFPSDLSDRITPLVLAVWYMDDGSITGTGDPRISFGLDDRSRARVLRALKTLGLRPVVYGTGGNQAIHFPKQAMLFRDLIEPYVHASLAYKLPFESEGKARHRRARGLTPEKAKSLYDSGMSAEQIGLAFQVGRTTVNRRLAQANTIKRRSGPRVVEYTAAQATSLLQEYDSGAWGSLPESEQSRWVDEVYAILRACPFPVPETLGPEKAQEVFEAVRQAKMSVGEQGSIQPIRHLGNALCSPFFPNRYKATSRGNKSAYEAWHLEKDLRRAIRLQFKVGDPVVPLRVLKSITMDCRTPTVFRPTVAKYLYERYCPKGGLVWDPCSGYGGRMLGALAAGVRYIGTDVEPETIEGNRRLVELLGAEVELHECPAEDFEPPQVDMVFTSPPYFNRELYSHRGEQSWKRHEGFEEWIEGFLRPVIRKAGQSLVEGGYLVLNVADVRYRKQIVPLVARTEQVAQEEGFILSERLRMPLPKLNREDPYEPILVFRPVGG